LFSAVWLLGLCLVFANSTSDPFRKMDFYFGVTGGGLFALCIFASFTGPIKRTCCSNQNDNVRQRPLLQPVLYHEPSAMLNISNVSVEKVMPSQGPISTPVAVARYVQQSDESSEESILSETDAVAVPLEGSELPHQLNQV
jgi:hypothetical protein